jgi:hypothetical protein
MYTTKKFTIAELKAKNAICPGTIVDGYTYVVTRYSVDASDDLIPEVYKQTDIASFGSAENAGAYCVAAYARDLDISSAIQYFYKVRAVEVY